MSEMGPIASLSGRPCKAEANIHNNGCALSSLRISGLLGDQYDCDARCMATDDGFADSRALMTSFAPATVTGRLMEGGPPSSAGKLMAACSPFFMLIKAISPPWWRTMVRAWAGL
jgi:hypothetical protein